MRSERWRYIRYRDGSEELYDHQNDPHEWNNLAEDTRWKEIKQRHREFLPEQEHSILGADSTGHRAFAAAEAMLADSQKGAVSNRAIPPD